MLAGPDLTLSMKRKVLRVELCEWKDYSPPRLRFFFLFAFPT
jgi:hypothetical protein